MSQLFITAVITTTIALAIFALFVRYSTPPELRPRLWLLFLLELPLQPLAFLFVRVPIDNVLRPALGGADSGVYNFTAVFYAPVTEERAWMLPIGFGFGIGEAWLIAALLAHKPELAKIPWYDFNGYVSERLMVCFIHCGMTGAGLLLSLGRGRWLLGTLLAISLHFAANCPLYFLGPHVLNVSAPTFKVIVSLWVVLAFSLSFLLILTSHHADSLGAKLFGKAKCSLCGTVFGRSLVGLNFGPRRFERCPNCKSWIWTTTFIEDKKSK